MTADPSALESRLKKADLVFKYLTIVSTIVTAAWAVYLYFEKKENELKDARNATAIAQQATAKELDLRRKEFQIGFFQKSLDLYLEACRTVGALASAESPDTPAVKSTVDRFYSLYWGDLSLVENREVESKMVEFEAAMRDWQAKGGLATQGMRQLAYDLAHVCRQDLEKSFDLKLDELHGSRNSFVAPVKGGTESKSAPSKSD